MRSTLVKRKIIYAVVSRYKISKLETPKQECCLLVSICAHQMIPKFYIFPFDKMYLDSTSLRRAKENYFINFLKPKLNRVT